MIQDLQAANAAEQVTVTYTISTNQSSITGTRGLSLMVQRLRLHTPKAAELRSHRLHRAAGKKKTTNKRTGHSKRFIKRRLYFIISKTPSISRLKKEIKKTLPANVSFLIA